MRLFFKTYLSPEPSGDYYWAPVENGARRKQQKTFKSRLLSWGGGKRMTKISLTKVEASKFMKFIKESSFALTEDEITGMNIFITTDGEKRFSLYRSLEKIKNKFKSIIKKLTGKSPPGRGSVQHILYLSPRIQLR